jgi:hypothetical protein
MRRAAIPTLFPMFRFLLHNSVRVNCVRVRVPLASRSDAHENRRFLSRSESVINFSKRFESLKIVLAFDSTFSPP